MAKELTRIDRLLDTIDEQLKDLQFMTPDEIRYKSLIIGTEGFPVSKNLACIIVGGKKRLNTLIEQGRIHYIEEPDLAGSANKKHKINFADCVRNTRPRLLKIHNATNSTFKTRAITV